ncbi:DUF4192 domain-containing protein [Umezawaea sp. NPDC059074]|uniref:DUF4192 domain-containing protein n=1 Tax=Umezawaea sp. NPDC059074 TaxID=3346716 RepID=UPI00369E8B72
MNTALSSIHLKDEGELIAALPSLFAFHPVDSLIAMVLRDGCPGKVVVSLRADLPPPRHRRALAHQLLPRLSAESGAVVLLVVGGGRADPEPPQRGLIDCLTSVLATEDVAVAEAIWAAGTTEGSRWVDYDNPEVTGTVSDPTANPLAVASTAVGFVTYPTRADLFAVLAPHDPEALARRTALLERATAELDPAEDREDRARRDLLLINRAVTAAHARTTPLSDDEVVALTTALANSWVRDMSLVFVSGPHRDAAERLWTELTRATPAPDRAQAATLLAYSAYVRGDGALASVALDQAQTANPDHCLASLVRSALDNALPPATLASLALTHSHPDTTPDGPA